MTALVHFAFGLRLAIAIRNNHERINKIRNAVKQRAGALADRDDVSRHLRPPHTPNEALGRARLQRTAVNRLEIHDPAILHVSLYPCRATSRSATGIS